MTTKGAHFSRRKGIRGEYEVRDYLRARGYEAYRVPLSGASEGYKSDVVATQGETRYTFEVKSRKDLFKSIYHLYYSLRGDSETIRLTSDGITFALSTDFEQIKGNIGEVFLKVPHDKVMKKIANMKKWLQGSDYLVIKNNNRILLWIKYY